MKKIFLVLTILLAVALLACGCTTDEVAQKLNKLAKLDYTVVTLKVETRFDEDTTLQSTFALNNFVNDTYLEYSVEQFVALEVGQVASDSKQTTEGKVSIRNGSVVNVPQDVSHLPLQQIANMQLDFRVRYIDRVVTENTVTATIANPEVFFGVKNFSGKDVQLKVQFGDALQSINITYTSAEGNLVTLTYNFVR